MIVLTDTAAWARRYGIEVDRFKCPVCRQEYEYILAIALKGWRGVLAPDHGCGKEGISEVVVDLSYYLKRRRGNRFRW